jgi:tetratricopeptide (TPR) repeat protein
VNIFVGTPGLGRSRALLEAQRHLRRHFCQALLIPADEAMTPYELVERIWRWAHAHAPRALDGIMPEDASAIAALWPWAFPDAHPAPAGVQIAKPLRNALATLLTAAGGNRLAILIDDWNLADASSRALLASGWKRELADFHWLLTGPEEVAGAMNWALEPLPADKVDGWLAGALHGAPPRGLAARLSAAGDGLPGWMIQALRHLVATGELDDPEAWNDVELAIPSTLEPLLEAQWNRLTPDQRALGEVLGIHGGPIGQAELEALQELLPTSWQLELTALVARDLLVTQAGAYRFANGAWPRWIRERTSAVRRQHVAVTMGRALERLWFPNASAEREPRLIYRLAALYEQGDQPHPIIRIMLEAGEAAARVFANQEAVSYFERGLQGVKLHPTPERVAAEALKLRVGLADAFRTMGEGESALRHYQKVLEGQLRAAQRGRLMVSLGKCHQMLGQAQEARTAFEEAVQLLTPLDDVDERLRAMISLGRAYHFAGENALCMDMYRRALDQATLHERDEYRADALSFLGNRMANQPETAAEGLDLLKQALALREHLTNRIAANDTHMLLGNALMSLGRYREAKQHFQNNLDLARSFQSWQDEGYARVNLALCEAELGHWPAVLEHLEECLRLGALVKDNVLVSVARCVEAQARMHVGDFELARRSLEAGKAMEEALGSADVRVITLMYEADCQLHWGAFEAARLDTERALELIAQGAGAEHAVHVGLLNAEANLHLGKLEVAEERLAAVEAQVERSGATGPRAHIRRVAGWLAWRQARPDQARKHWDEGLAIAEAEGLEHLEARLRLSLYLVERQQLGSLPDMASLERACELAEKRRTPEVLALGCLALALVLRKADHQQPAERMVRRGREVMGLLTQALPNPRARDAFMSHPERTPFCEVGDAERIELLERRSRRLEMLLALVRELAAQRDAKKVLEMARDFTLEVTRAERVLVLLNPGRGELESFDGQAATFSRTIVGRVAAERQALCVLDTLMDGELNVQASLLDMQVRAVMCVPLQIDRTLHGVIYVDSRVAMGAFTEEDLEIVQAIGMQTAVALDNARMYALLQAQLNKKS